MICEGAGSPAEINLRRTDIVNMGIARNARLPVLVVGDIDRGGVFASFFGTVALLSPEDQELVAGFLVNKFRGDVSLLEPGLDMLHGLTGRHTYGVLPFRHGLGIDEEDGLRPAFKSSTALRGTVRESNVAPPLGEDVLRVAVCAVPLMSNFTDVDALAAEPGVVVRFVDRPEELADADLVIVPGTRGTVKALEWLRERGLADVLVRRASEQRPVLGICGGYQILGEHIEDEVESRRGHVEGLGVLPVRVRFAREKTLTRPVGEALGEPVEGTRSITGSPRSPAEKPSSPMTGDTAWTAAGSAGPGARTGTVRWSRTGSGGPSCVRWRPPRAAASCRPPTPRSPRCARSSSTGSAT